MDDFQTNTLHKQATRRTYLVTYSQANLNRFPTRESFGEAIKTAFNCGSGKVQVEYWACSLEEHQNGGRHYHVCVKLTGSKRWLSVKEHLRNTHNIVVNFSGNHDHYYSAYSYVTKTDKSFYVSESHPNLSNIGSPQTEKCIKKFRAKRKQKSEGEASEGHAKIKRLSNLEVSEFIVSCNIRSDTELFAEAHSQKSAGKKDLASFILSRSPKAINDLIENTWKMETASSTLSRRELSRMDIIRESALGQCSGECGGQWLQCAVEVLTSNRINPAYFASALRDLLERGRGKHRNIMIVGRANCGKTFIFRPLEVLFKTFTNPANDKYAWIGAEEKIIYSGRYHSRDPTEDEMMSVRWKVF